MPDNVIERKILEPYWIELLVEQNKDMFNQKKFSCNLQQIIVLVYGLLSKNWAAMEAEKQSFGYNEREANPLWKIVNL